MSDDGRLGFRVKRTTSHQFYVFQLIVDGEIFGDDSPCIAGSAFGGLRSPNVVDDRRLDPDKFSAQEVDAAIFSDDALHTPCVQHLAESLDDCTILMFVFAGNVNLIVTPHDSHVWSRAVIPSEEFRELVAAMCHFMGLPGLTP